MATINGTAGKDKLSGTNDEDLIQGFAGNDKIEGFGDADVIDGGAGTDTASYKHSESSVTVDLGENQDAEGGDAEGDSLISIENLIGSDLALGSDRLFGND